MQGSATVNQMLMCQEIPCHSHYIWSEGRVYFAQEGEMKKHNC